MPRRRLCDWVHDVHCRFDAVIHRTPDGLWCAHAPRRDGDPPTLVAHYGYRGKTDWVATTTHPYPPR